MASTFESDARRWKRGSKKRIDARTEAEEKGLCTTCVGKRGWSKRELSGRIVRVTCTNCGGSGRRPGHDFPLGGDAA